jgi:hypothetical protein
VAKAALFVDIAAINFDRGLKDVHEPVARYVHAFAATGSPGLVTLLPGASYPPDQRVEELAKCRLIGLPFAVVERKLIERGGAKPITSTTTCASTAFALRCGCGVPLLVVQE